MEDSLNGLMGPMIADARALELYASVWYLLPGRPIPQGDEERFIAAVANEKPHFTEGAVRGCVKAVLLFRARAALPGDAAHSPPPGGKSAARHSRTPAARGAAPTTPRACLEAVA